MKYALLLIPAALALWAHRSWTSQHLYFDGVAMTADRRRRIITDEQQKHEGGV